MTGARIGAAIRCGAAALVFTTPVVAGEFDVSGSITPELRYFPDPPQFEQQENTDLSPSVAGEVELVYDSESGDDRFTVTPFLRLDADDSNRTHADLRAGNWLHLGDGWDTVVGVDKVFWGVTESRHLVDIINQDDSVEDTDGEAKLGQPMLNLNVEGEYGTFSGFVLPYFRERIFPATSARFGGSTPVEERAATFDSAAKERHVDFAARWAQIFGDLDVGLTYFHGTSREPVLLKQDGVLVPHYDQIDQTGLDMQLTTDATLWKLEAITRSGQGDRFIAAVVGLEHTLFGVGETNADLGLLAEYLYDGRQTGRAPFAVADDDIFVGARLALNDEPDTQGLLGAVVDRSTGSTLLFLEAERRIGETWRAEITARFFLNVDSRDELAGSRDDGFIRIQLGRFF